MDMATYKRTFTKRAHICVGMDVKEALLREIYLDCENPNISGYWMRTTLISWPQSRVLLKEKGGKTTNNDILENGIKAGEHPNEDLAKDIHAKENNQGKKASTLDPKEWQGV